jgi:hypothetical protein
MSEDFGRLDLGLKTLATKLLKRDADSFRAHVSATQEELQTWRLSAISQNIDLYKESESGYRMARVNSRRESQPLETLSGSAPTERGEQPPAENGGIPGLQRVNWQA